MYLRIAAGFLLCLLILLIGTIPTELSDKPMPIELYPWIRYAFFTVLSVTVIVWIILWKRERKTKEINHIREEE